MSALVGFSLPLNYLSADSGEYLTGSDALLWQAFGNADMCLIWLKRGGVQSIETRDADHGADTRKVLLAAERIGAAGMGLTLHASLPPEEMGATLAETYPYLAALVRSLPSQQHSITVTIHAYACGGQSAADNGRRTARVLMSMVTACYQEGLPIEWALEINRARGLPDPATTFEDVVGIVQAVAVPEIGICWDVGHTLANLRSGIVTLPAPEAFVRQVIHTHIHGIGLSGQTHCAVTSQSTPLHPFIQPLRSAGYAGVYNLELSPDRMTAEETLKSQFADSISALQIALGELPVGVPDIC